MCWSATASVAMVGLGGVATGFAIRQGAPKAVWLTLGYFTAMEGLQAVGYSVIDQCGTPENRAITALSFLHIVFQPFFINAFAMTLVLERVTRRTRRNIYLVCVLCSAVMLAQLIPFDWAGPCRAGSPLCGETLCLVSGQWHIAWDVPYNGMLDAFEDMIGFHAGFPTYMVAAFFLPLVYGAWRFVVFHAVAGPILAFSLTDNPNEAPAIWCLFSIGVLLIGCNVTVRRQFQVRAA